MTRNDLEKAARDLLEESFRTDPVGTEETVLRVLGRPVFAWSLLTIRELRALRRAIYPTVLEGRG